MILSVVSLIFAVNIAVFSICDGRPWIDDENAVEESGDFELQPREPITFAFLGILFLIRTFARLITSHQKNHPTAPMPYSAAPGSPVYQLPTPPNASVSQSFKIFVWNMYENWQRKLKINPYVPPHQQPKGYLSSWGGFKFFIWNWLENRQRKLRITVPGYPG